MAAWVSVIVPRIMPKTSVTFFVGGHEIQPFKGQSVKGVFVQGLFGCVFNNDFVKTTIAAAYEIRMRKNKLKRNSFVTQSG